MLMKLINCGNIVQLWLMVHYKKENDCLFFKYFYII